MFKYITFMIEYEEKKNMTAQKKALLYQQGFKIDLKFTARFQLKRSFSII